MSIPLFTKADQERGTNPSKNFNLYGDFAMEVKGSYGKIGFFRKAEELKNGEIGAVFFDDHIEIRRWYLDSGKVVLINAFHECRLDPVVIDPENIKVLGKLTGTYETRGEI